jgi:orotate phosphoribosyltransferase
MSLRRGFRVERGERALIVEDVVTTGGSVKEVIELLRGMGVDIAGIGAIVDRSGGAVDFGADFRPLVAMDIKSWNERECPLCVDGVPIKKPGSRGA